MRYFYPNNPGISLQCPTATKINEAFLIEASEGGLVGPTIFQVFQEKPVKNFFTE